MVPDAESVQNEPEESIPQPEKEMTPNEIEETESEFEDQSSDENEDVPPARPQRLRKAPVRYGYSQMTHVEISHERSVPGFEFPGL